MKSQKNSFIFLETIVSLIVVSIIVAIFFKLSYDNNTNKKFQKLNTLSNKLKKSDYSNMQSSQEEITILENGVGKELLVKKITTNSDEIKLYKYELIK
ncbi:hypothetical protein [Arcobacter sp. F2176]|uniref:hypothetical protein n=1 Tax=unclassified Arcobacter TaxID=2593671 RepID=UPI00100BEDF6|nr:hypothetical protein [Arcobacter sp. F2176]RXJ81792.1 hypothetical protein CRU95_05475 [Arcobacter sp. F2176]